MSKPSITTDERTRLIAEAFGNPALSAAGLLPPDDKKGAPETGAADQPDSNSPAPTAGDTPSETGAPGDKPAAKALVLGKYESEQEATKAHWELHGHAAEVKGENAALRARIAELEKGANANPDVSAIDAALQELGTFGVDPETARRAIQAVAAETIKEVLKREVEPREAQAAAVADMRKNYRGFAALETDVYEFANTDADTKAAVDSLIAIGDMKTAHVVAWTRFKEANAEKVEAAIKARAKESATTREEAKNDAQLTPSSKGSNPARRADPDRPNDEVVQRLTRLARNGDRTARARLIAYRQNLRLPA